MREAAREFASAGYERASLNRIIRACGMSKSSFYHLFASKRDLFELTVRDLSAALLDTTRIPAPAEFSAEFWPKVERLFDQLTSAALGDESFTALGRMFYLSGVPGDEHNAVSESLAAAETWLREVLETGRRTGAVRDDLPVALQSRLVFAILRTLDEWTLTHSDHFAPEELTRLVRAELGTIRRVLEG